MAKKDQNIVSELVIRVVDDNSIAVLSRTGEKLARYGRSVQQVAMSSAELAEKSKRAAAGMISSGDALNALAGSYGRDVIGINNATSALDDFGDMAFKLNNILAQVNPMFQFLAERMKESIKVGTEFETGLANIGTLLEGDVNEQLKEFNIGLRNIMLSSPKEATDILAAGYDTVSAGVLKASDALKIVNESQKLAVAGLGTTQQAVDAVTTILNAYSMSGEDAALVTSSLMGTIKAGKNTLETLAPSLGKVIAVGASIGVSMNEINAATATLTATGLPAAEAQTNLRMAMLSMLKPTKEMSALIRAQGYETGAAMIASEGMRKSLIKLTVATRGNEEMFTRAFSRVQGLTAATILGALRSQKYGEDLAKLDAEMIKAGTSASALEQAYARKLDTMESLIETSRQLWIELKRQQFEELERVGKPVIEIFRQIARFMIEAKKSSDPFIRLMRDLSAQLPLVALGFVGVIVGLANVLAKFGLASLGFKELKQQWYTSAEAQKASTQAAKDATAAFEGEGAAIGRVTVMLNKMEAGLKSIGSRSQRNLEASKIQAGLASAAVHSDRTIGVGVQPIVPVDEVDLSGPTESVRRFATNIALATVNAGIMLTMMSSLGKSSKELSEKYGRFSVVIELLKDNFFLVSVALNALSPLIGIATSHVVKFGLSAAISTIQTLGLATALGRLTTAVRGFSYATKFGLTVTVAAAIAFVLDRFIRAKATALAATQEMREKMQELVETSRDTMADAMNELEAIAPEVKTRVIAALSPPAELADNWEAFFADLKGRITKTLDDPVPLTGAGKLGTTARDHLVNYFKSRSGRHLLSEEELALFRGDLDDNLSKSPMGQAAVAEVKGILEEMERLETKVLPKYREEAVSRLLDAANLLYQGTDLPDEVVAAAQALQVDYFESMRDDITSNSLRKNFDSAVNEALEGPLRSYEAEAENLVDLGNLIQFDASGTGIEVREAIAELDVFLTAFKKRRLELANARFFEDAIEGAIKEVDETFKFRVQVASSALSDLKKNFDAVSDAYTKSGEGTLAGVMDALDSVRAAEQTLTKAKIERSQAIGAHVTDTLEGVKLLGSLTAQQQKVLDDYSNGRNISSTVGVSATTKTVEEVKKLGRDPGRNTVEDEQRKAALSSAKAQIELLRATGASFNQVYAAEDRLYALRIRGATDSINQLAAFRVELNESLAVARETSPTLARGIEETIELNSIATEAAIINLRKIRQESALAINGEDNSLTIGMKSFAQSTINAGSLTEQFGLTLGQTLNGVADGFAAMAAGTKVSFNDMARSVLSDLTKMIIKSLMLKAIMQAMGWGLNEFGVSEDAVNSGQLGQTGITGGQPDIIINPNRTYATGGIIPGRNNTPVPMIGHSGEGVFTPKQMDNADSLFRGMAAMNGGGNTVINVVNKNPENSVEVATTRGPNGEEQIDILVAKVEQKQQQRMSRGGGLSPFLESTYGLRRTSGGQR